MVKNVIISGFLLFGLPQGVVAQEVSSGSLDSYQLIGTEDAWGGFRARHNFQFLAGTSGGLWESISIPGKTFIRTEAEGRWSKFFYSYHIPLVGGLGYFMGSSFGYYHEEKLLKNGVSLVPAYHLPGLYSGGVMNVSPVSRVAVGLDFYLERLDNLTVEESGGENKMSLTMQTMSLFASFDWFIAGRWGASLFYSYRTTENRRPANTSSGEQLLVDSKLRKVDQMTGLGVVYHLR